MNNFQKLTIDMLNFTVAESKFILISRDFKEVFRSVIISWAIPNKLN